MTELVTLAQGVFAWVPDEPGPGAPNAGVVLDTDGATVIDTLAVPSQYEPFAGAVGALGFPVRRVVLTGDHLDFVGGTVAFKTAGVYGSPSASAHLDQPADPDVLRALHPDLADEIDDDIRTRSVTHVVAEATQLTAATFAVPLDGQSARNLAVVVPESDVVFAGALGSFGITPVAFDGDPGAWADSLDGLVELATRIVPGHGPIGGEPEVRALQAYLRACVEAEGDPARIPAGPWDEWPGRHWDAVNVERAAMLARGEHAPPPTLLRALGLG